MTKLKNLNCDKTKKIKFGQNSKTTIVTKLTNSICDKTQIMTQLKTVVMVTVVTVVIVTVVSVLTVTVVIVTVVRVILVTIAVVTVAVVTFFSKKNFTPPKPMRFLRAAFRDLAMFFKAFPKGVIRQPVLYQPYPNSI